MISRVVVMFGIAGSFREWFVVVLFYIKLGPSICDIIFMGLFACWWSVEVFVVVLE